MKPLLISIAVVIMASSQAAAQYKAEIVALDPSANFLTRLFFNACLDTGWRPDKIRAWAELNHANVISDPKALAVFVGEGEKGQAWGIPMPFGSFALSIRGKTQACVAWARTANAQDAEKLFRALVEGTRRPGFDIRIDQDKVIASADGPKHVLSYTLFPSGKAVGAYAMMQAIGRPEGGSLVSLEILTTKQDEPAAQ